MRISSLSVAICCITFWDSTWVCSKNRQPQSKFFFSASTSFFIWNLIICKIGSSSRIFFPFVKCQIWILLMILRVYIVCYLVLTKTKWHVFNSLTDDMLNILQVAQILTCRNPSKSIWQDINSLYIYYRLKFDVAM